MTSVPYQFGSRDCADITALCSSFTGKRLQSPTRSTVPLIDLVHNNRAAWLGLLQNLGAPSSCSVQFEAEVPSPKRAGNPSQTDAVFASKTTIWAVEAKWTEPPDKQTVAKRLSKPESDGGDPRLTVNGWLEHLQQFASRPLQLGEFADIIYQLVHRAASAAYLATQRNLQPELVYLHFVPSPDPRSATTEHYVSELRRLRAKLDASSGFVFRVIEMGLDYTAHFETIRSLDKHSRATSRDVRDALRSGPLFTFGQPSITLV